MLLASVPNPNAHGFYHDLSNRYHSKLRQFTETMTFVVAGDVLIIHSLDMLNKIKIGIASKQESPVNGMLIECHARIRHFSEMALRLATNPSTRPTEVASATEALCRYFTVALPLHEADENDSIHPRLTAITRDIQSDSFAQAASAACDAMVEQHKAIDVILEQLVSIWKSLQKTPEKAAELSTEMLALSTKLKGLFQDHLKLEEETVFPAIEKLLPPQELEALLFEMKKRRNQ